jgi:hypothetical protein
MFVPGPNGQPVPVPFNSMHHSMLGIPPGVFPHGMSPASIVASQQTPTNNSSVKQQGVANATIMTPTTISTAGTATKSKKGTTAKQRKQREKDEQLRREQDAQQNQQANFVLFLNQIRISKK